MTSLLIFRTNYIDKHLIDNVSYFSQHLETAIVFHGVEKPEIVSPKNFVLTNEDVIVDLGLKPISDFGWRCGDYNLILARKNFPDYENYWMIEPDVLVAFPNPFDFISEIDRVSSDDFLATHMRVASRDWRWFAAMENRFETVMQCFFPLIRISGTAIDLVYDWRRRLAEESLVKKIVPEWPNDEVTVASVVLNHGLTLRDFSHYIPDLYSIGTFHSGLPMPYSKIKCKKEERKIYHPVLSGSRYAARAMQLISKSRDSGTIKYLRNCIDIEVGQGCAEELCKDS